MPKKLDKMRRRWRCSPAVFRPKSEQCPALFLQPEAFSTTARHQPRARRLTSWATCSVQASLSLQKRGRAWLSGRSLVARGARPSASRRSRPSSFFSETRLSAGGGLSSISPPFHTICRCCRVQRSSKGRPFCQRHFLSFSPLLGVPLSCVLGYRSAVVSTLVRKSR